MKNLFFYLLIALLCGGSALLQAQCSFTVNGQSPPFFLCSSNTPATLSGSPAGGVFSGVGVIGGTFNPLPNLLPGTFTVTYTVAGCVVSQPIFVDTPNLEAIIDNSIGQLFCQNEAPITLTGNAGVNGIFTIDNNVLPANLFVPANYPLNTPLSVVYTYVSPNGCTSTDQTTFTVTAAPSIPANLLPAEVCIGAAPLTLPSVQASSSFLYSGAGVLPDGTFSPANAGLGTHPITITAQQLSCSVTQVANITVKPTLSAAIGWLGTPCLGGNDTLYYTGAPLDATAQLDWLLPDDANVLYDGNDTIVVEHGSAGEKTVSLLISNTATCVPDSVGQVLVKELVGVSTIASLTQTEGQSIALTTVAQSSEGGTLSYVWQPAAALSCTDCLSPIATTTQTTTYHITASSTNGCTATDSTTISIVLNDQVFIPNIFTPNDDQQNDRFLVYNSQIAAIDMQIFDRWGATIYRTNNLSEGWDGTANNAAAQLGAYLYLIDITFSDGTARQYKGTVTLAR